MTMPAIMDEKVIFLQSVRESGAGAATAARGSEEIAGAVAPDPLIALPAQGLPPTSTAGMEAAVEESPVLFLGFALRRVKLSLLLASSCRRVSVDEGSGFIIRGQNLSQSDFDATLIRIVGNLKGGAIGFARRFDSDFRFVV
jgi:hypothetical protein